MVKRYGERRRVKRLMKMFTMHLPVELFDDVVKAAAEETIKTGKKVSVAEWVRRAIKNRLGVGQNA